MKVTRTEKWWLLAVCLFFLLYNLPGLPGYQDAHGLIVHALLTVVPLWVCIYVGLFRVLRKYRLKK